MALPGFGGGGGGSFGGLKNIARAGVQIVPDTDGFDRTLSSGLNKVIRGVGAGAVAGLGGFLAAGAGAAIAGAATFANFESSLAKIRGLVGVSNEELEIMERKLLDLGPAVGKGPQELADALFFITSAGLRGEIALEALEAAARASAAGLGETTVIADALTSAINAYGAENLSATEATNALVGAVREGKLEADTLAQVVGRIIPLASAMGIEFQEVTAALAAMSRTGLDANEAATALRGIMNTLLKPTAEAEALFVDFGTSIGDIRRIIRDQGLFEGLLALGEVIGGNEDALADVIPNVRALSGFLNLLGENADANRQIFDNLLGSTDFLGEALGAASETGAFAFQQAMAELQTVLIEIGRDTLPAFVDLLKDLLPVLREGIVPAIQFAAELFTNFAVGVARLVVNFTNLPGPIKATVTALAAGVAVFGAFQTVLGPIALAVGAIGFAIAQVGREARANAAEVDAFTEAFQALNDAAPGEEAFQPLEEIGRRLANPAVLNNIRALGVDVTALAKAIEGGKDATTEFVIGPLADLAEETGNVTAFRELRGQLFDLERDYRSGAEAAAELTAEQALLNLNTDDLSREQVELLQSLGLLVPVWDTVRRQARLVTREERDQILAAQALGDENADLADSTDDVVTGLANEEDALEEMRTDAIGAADAIRDLTAANLEALNPTLALFRALEDREDAEKTFLGLRRGAEGYDEALLDLLEAEARVQAAQGEFITGFGPTKQAFFELAQEIGVPTAAAQTLFDTLVNEPTRNEQEIIQAYGLVGEFIKDGVLSPIPSISEAAKAELQRALLGADFSDLVIPGVVAPFDLTLVPRVTVAAFDTPTFGTRGFIPEGSNPGGGGPQTVNNEFNINNPAPESPGESVERTVLDPRIQRALIGGVQ